MGAFSSRLILFRGIHSQGLRTPTEQNFSDEVFVSRMGGFRCVSAAKSLPDAASGISNLRRDIVVCLGWMGCKDKHLDNVITVHLFCT
jgi:hypothetical protein